MLVKLNWVYTVCDYKCCYYQSDTLQSARLGRRRISLSLNIKYKLLNKNFHYDVRKYSARVVNIWNSLPDYVVDVDSVSNFKSRLDKFWLEQPVMFDWKADLTGTGSRSLKCDIRVD